MIARAWYKYLSYDEHVAHIQYFNLQHIKRESDNKIVIHFHPELEIDKDAINILYFQNAYPDPPYQGGSLGQFNKLYNTDRYDAFIFPSDTLASACMEDKIDPFVAIPFATDPEIFYPMESDPQYQHQVVMVGNNIRGEVINEQYIAPALQHLTLFGNPAGWPSKYLTKHKGKLPHDDESVLYCSSSICLNAHISEHIKYDVINFRIYNILACGGFVITDSTTTLETEFKDSVFITPGYDKLIDAITHFICNPHDTIKYRQNGLELVKKSHTFKHRIEKLTNFLSGICQ
jgi:spore maturation protein CgeB